MRELQCALVEERKRHGWTQAQLAGRAGVSRAEVSAIETGRLVPSALTALRLARVLGVRVEAVFSLAQPESRMEWAWPGPAGDERVWAADVGGRTLLYPIEPTAAGAIGHQARAVRGGLEALPAAPSPERTLVIAGCDPMVGLLVAEIGAQSGVRVLPLPRSSGEALDLLHRGLVHVAGIHLGEGGRSRNADAVRSRLGSGYRLLHLVRWEEGVAVTPGRARSIEGLLRGRVRWVNREEGSGARRCLDHLLGARPRPEGYERIARDHRALAGAISTGWAEAGICVKAVALESRLDFLPVQREAYDLCFADALLADPRIQALLAAVRSARYRLVLKDVPGWDTRQTGDLRAVA